MESLITESAWIVGIILAVTLYLYFIQKMWCRAYGRSVIYMTGWIGTPIHELAHAIVHVLFGHKVLEISLFNPEPKTGVLGYVNYSYNPRSIVHNVGRFYAGIAPLFANLALAYVVLKWIPESPKTSKEWAIFGGGVYVAVSLAMHAAPSPVDLKGSFSGGIVLAALMAVGFYFFPDFVVTVTTVLSEILKKLAPTVVLVTLPLLIVAGVAFFTRKVIAKKSG